MHETRVVPISETMAAGVPFVDLDRRDGPSQPFFEYLNSHDLFWEASMPADRLEEHLAALPECDASTAVTAIARVALDLTAADVLRPYDRVVFDSPAEQQAIADLDSLRVNLEESSPLLAPVADIVCAAPGHPAGESVFTVQTWLACVTGPTLRTVPNTESYCDWHEQHDCAHADHSQHIAWAHVEFIAPGTRAKIEAAAQVFADALPTVGEFDNGRSRMTPEYWKHRNRL